MNLPLEVIVGMGTKVWSYIDNTVKLVILHYRAVQHPQGRCAQRGDLPLYKRVSPLLHQKSAR